MIRAHGERASSLSDLRILSIAQNVPGPVAVARLVAGGATAIKIEAPWGDPLERMCKSWYAQLHAGVRIERLDLKAAAGISTLNELLASADVLVASHRPGALARLALDADSLALSFPALRHLNIVGDTANPEEAGHDLTYQARAGLLQGGMPLTLVADMVGAEHAHAAVLALMQDAPGSSRIVGLFDGLNAIAAPLRHGLTAPGGPLGGGNPAYAVYAAKDGMVAIGALEPHFRARLYDALGLTDGSDLSVALLTRTATEWERWAAERDIPLVEIQKRSS
jgi:crotonobetainyl-CoA:carnitine CoA-transferase CaiB-like acyl-CoA transferase